MFLLPHAAEIKDLTIQRKLNQPNLVEIIVLFGSEQHVGEVIIHVEQKYKTMGGFRYVG